METETPTGTNSDYRKRARSVSVSSSDSSMSGDMDSLPSSPRPFSAPAAKYHRAPSPERIHLCTLAPTCSQPDTAQSFSSQTELDAHQASFHRWICHVPIRDKPGRIGEGDAVLFVPEQFAGRSPAGRTRERWRECGKVFPEERLLDLHYTETHDPLTRERQERGEATFACFLDPQQCDKVFLTPKKRRMHLIAKHHYPTTYYFSITNHGLNQIARTDGLAASLIRPRKDPLTEGMSMGSTEAGGGHTAAYRSANVYSAPSVPPPEVNMAVDDLARQMAGLQSSLTFVPRGVQRRRARETRSSAMD